MRGTHDGSRRHHGSRSIHYASSSILHYHRSRPISTSDPSAADDDSDAGVLSQYLRSLLSLFFKRFLSSVLPALPRLTEIGAAQLAADLDYLSNISSVIYSERVKASSNTGKRLLRSALRRVERWSANML